MIDRDVIFDVKSSPPSAAYMRQWMGLAPIPRQAII